jgi:16S rRNA (guanine966-N2)-methyltransferase
MRVVGGEARGRRFDAPPGTSTRPTSDRVREAIFGVLGSLPVEFGAGVEEATVADLFAGSGAYGIEALSRGAARVTFVDTDRQAVATIDANLAHLGWSGRPRSGGPTASGRPAPGPRTTVVRGDALRWLNTAGPTDVVFCDPPYAFDQWPQLCSLLAPVAAVAVMETGAPLDPGAGWEVLREKQYGGTVVVVARPVRSPEPAPDRKGDP